MERISRARSRSIRLATKRTSRTARNSRPAQRLNEIWDWNRAVAGRRCGECRRFAAAFFCGELRFLISLVFCLKFSSLALLFTFENLVGDLVYVGGSLRRI